MPRSIRSVAGDALLRHLVDQDAFPSRRLETGYLEDVPLGDDTETMSNSLACTVELTAHRARTLAPTIIDLIGFIVIP